MRCVYIRNCYKTAGTYGKKEIILIHCFKLVKFYNVMSGIFINLKVRNRPPKSGPTCAVASRTEWPSAISRFFTFGDRSTL